MCFVPNTAAYIWRETLSCLLIVIYYIK